MERFFRQVIEQVKTVWGRLNPIQRGIYIGSIILIFLCFLGIILFASRTEYVVLYADIDPIEAGRITSKLDEWKQDYKLEETTIRVPTKDKSRLRVRLASENLAPTRGLVYYDIFDKTKLAQTDYERQINYIRALQGELTRTIEGIDQVQQATVLLVMPKRRLYVDEQEDATASIKLRLKPFDSLEKGQVKGIINLTAAAVEGLNPENVTIVDSKGNILSDIIVDEEGDIGELTAKQLEIQRQEGKRLEKKIRRSLATVLGGNDRVEVIVKWEMDFDRVEEREEKYSTPGFEQLMVSQETEVEHFKGEGVRPGGPPGVEAQIPGYKGLTPGHGPVVYTKDDRRTNYLADKKEIAKVLSPFISKISVAVFIDGTYERDKEGKLKRDDEGIPIYIVRTPEEMAKYEELIRAAIGFDRKREYKEREYIVRVENIQFDRTQEWLREKEEMAWAKRRMMMNIALGVVGLLAVGGIFFFMFKGARARARREEEVHRREMERIAVLKGVEEKGKGISPEIIDLEDLKAKPEPTAGLVRAALGEE